MTLANHTISHTTQQPTVCQVTLNGPREFHLVHFGATRRNFCSYKIFGFLALHSAIASLPDERDELKATYSTYFYLSAPYAPLRVCQEAQSPSVFATPSSVIHVHFFFT